MNDLDNLVIGFIVTAFVLVGGSAWFAHEHRRMLALAYEVVAFVLMTASVWMLYHFGEWTPESLQLVGAALYSMMAAVWVSGMIDRAKEAFRPTGDDVDTGWPPLVAVDETDPDD